MGPHVEVDLAPGRVAEGGGDGGHRGREPAVGRAAVRAEDRGADCTAASLPVGRGESLVARRPATLDLREEARGPDRSRGARRRRGRGGPRPAPRPRRARAWSGPSTAAGAGVGHRAAVPVDGGPTRTSSSTGSSRAVGGRARRRRGARWSVVHHDRTRSARSSHRRLARDRRGRARRAGPGRVRRPMPTPTGPVGPPAPLGPRRRSAQPLHDPRARGPGSSGSRRARAASGSRRSP